MTKSFLSLLLILAFAVPTLAADGVFFVTPKNGAKVKSPFKAKFGVKGKKIKPAGEAIDDPAFGHHHLIIDGASHPEGTVVPANATNIHYGKGQTEDQVTLPPGKHKLTLQFADGLHRSYGEKWSKTIEIIVK